MNKKTLVSVIIPCYNQAIYLPDALESLLAQTYTGWEGIIVDDGSPDNTKEIALLYLGKDVRFRYISKTNGGLSSARNCGINAASGEYILPLDADDTLEPTFIEKTLQVFLDVPATTLVYCWGNYFGLKEGHWNMHYQGYMRLLLGNSIFCSALFRKDSCIRIGGYDEEMRLGCEDWDFFIRLLDEQSIVYQIPEALFNYRVKEVSMITECRKNMADMYNYIYKKNMNKYFPFFDTAIIAFRELLHYKRKVEKYKNKWYRRFFKSFKYVALFGWTKKKKQ